MANATKANTAARMAELLDVPVWQVEQMLNDQYGKVDRETWEKKKAELEELRELLIQNRMEQTLREDYGFGFDVDGEFYVVYSASCQAPGCDFHYQYKHHEPVSMDETIDDCDEE